MKKQLKIDSADTIAAISTSLGEAAIGIVRISGKDAVMVADRIFKSKKGKSPSAFRSFTTHYGHVFDKDKIVDEALLTLMRMPKSYTKEDMVEISCHGGAIPLKRTLELVLNNGARIAEPGEFTKRAFLNGRLDLTQAEAVLDVIRSKTDASLKMALGQLSGRLSSCLNEIKDELVSVSANMEASIDFPDEALEIISEANIKGRLESVRSKLAKLLESADNAIAIREGICCVICGKPNVGKSSLLNALLEREKAIVTHIPGTTRDAIEDYANIKGIPFKLIDTAGIAPTEDIVEREGILRSRGHMEQSDLILLVLDASGALSEEDKTLLADTKERARIIVINKIDLPQKMDLGHLSADRVVKISAKQLKGMDDLKKKMEEAVLGVKTPAIEGAVITNLRQKGSLRGASESVEKALKSVEEGLSPEFTAIELKGALDCIGEVVGEIVSDDILDKIFSQFCVGK